MGRAKRTAGWEGGGYSANAVKGWLGKLPPGRCMCGHQVDEKSSGSHRSFEGNPPQPARGRAAGATDFVSCDTIPSSMKVPCRLTARRKTIVRLLARLTLGNGEALRPQLVVGLFQHVLGFGQSLLNGLHQRRDVTPVAAPLCENTQPIQEIAQFPRVGSRCQGQGAGGEGDGLGVQPRPFNRSRYRNDDFSLFRA